MPSPATATNSSTLITHHPHSFSPWYAAAQTSTPTPPLQDLRMQANGFVQIAQLAGLSMLLLATAVFVYYTMWTLFMVRLHAKIIISGFLRFSTDFCAVAIRGRNTLPAPTVPRARVGDPRTCDPVADGVCGGRDVLEHGDDQERAKEAGKDGGSCGRGEEGRLACQFCVCKKHSGGGREDVYKSNAKLQRCSK